MKPVAASRGVAEGGQRHDPRIAEAQGWGLPGRICGRVRDPLEGWTREDAALADAFSLQDSLVGGAGLGLEFVEVG